MERSPDISWRAPAGCSSTADPGVLARLRSNGKNGWPDVDAIAISHFHLDHWGDLVPWVWGRMWGLGQEYEPPELWLPPGGREELAAFGTRFGTPDMFIRVFEPKEYTEGEEFEAAGLKLVATRLPHYTVQTFGFRISNSTRTLAYSGDSGPSERLSRLADGVDLFLCEATLERGELDGEPRGHLSAEEAVAAFEASGAKRLLLTHRPKELIARRRPRAGPRRASARRLEDRSLAPDAPDLAERVAHLAHRHVLA